jgi:hypothetical protein
MDDEGLRAALDRLVERGVLDREQAGAVLAEMGEPPRPGAPGVRRLLGEIAGYLGAAFVVGATLLLLGDRWAELGRGGRVAILAAMAAVLFAAGWAVRQRRRGPADEVRRRLASTLLTGSAAAAAFAVYASLAPEDPADYETPWDPAGLAAALTGLAVVLAGYLLAGSALGQLGVAAAALAVVGTGLELADLLDAVPFGLAAVALAAAWAVLAWRRFVRERRAALAIAVALGLFGAQLPVLGGGDAAGYLGYLLTAVVVAACFGAYTRMREWVLVAGGVAGATVVVPEFLYDITGGSLGAAGVLLVAGVTLLAGSLAGLRIRRPAEEAAP